MKPPRAVWSSGGLENEGAARGRAPDMVRAYCQGREGQRVVGRVVAAEALAKNQGERGKSARNSMHDARDAIKGSSLRFSVTPPDAAELVGTLLSCESATQARQARDEPRFVTADAGPMDYGLDDLLFPQPLALEPPCPAVDSANGGLPTSPKSQMASSSPTDCDKCDISSEGKSSPSSPSPPEESDSCRSTASTVIGADNYSVPTSVLTAQPRRWGTSPAAHRTHRRPWPFLACSAAAV